MTGSVNRSQPACVAVGSDVVEAGFCAKRHWVKPLIVVGVLVAYLMLASTGRAESRDRVADD